MSDVEKMKQYWNKVGARDDVNWQIAHIADDQDFAQSGLQSLQKVFPQGLAEFKPNSRVLDIGCGKGRLAKALATARRDVRVVGVDVSNNMIGLATAEAEDLLNLSYVTIDGVSLSPFAADTFDCIYSYIVLQHLPRAVVKRLVTDAVRVLKPGGTFVFQVQSKAKAQVEEPADTDFRRIRYYTAAQAVALVAPPLTLVETRGTEGMHDFFVVTTKV